MDVREIKKLISLMNENGLARLEVEEEGKRYLLEKEGAASTGGTPVFVGGVPAGAAAAGPLTVPVSQAPPPEPAPAEPAQRPEDTVTFNSPMVGTLYRAPTPDAESFVQVGDKVDPETVLCLIEAMKVFNEIKAETSGTIVEALADNGEAVEYNQPLFLIKP